MKSPLTWMRDRNLCGSTFAGPTWEAGRTLVASLFGLTLTPAMVSLYQACTGRALTPRKAFQRGFVAAGRGSGKTLLASFVSVFVAASRDWRAIMGPGELATVALICPDRRQVRVAMRFVRGLLRQSPMLSKLIVSETADSITLSTGCVIEVHTASFRSTRGYSFAAVVIDECAFLPTDEAGANPDHELVRAVTPGLARVPGSLLLCISSPFAKRGVLWDAFRKFHGVDDAPVLTWQAPTRVMNPTISEDIVTDALEEDESAARAEWLAEFRDDLESFVSNEILRAVTIPGRGDLPPVPGVRYAAFTDPAGGGSGRFADSFTIAIAHAKGCVGVVDALLEIRPPFSPEAAVAEVAALLAPYGIRSVTGDKYAGEWPASRFKACGISYVPSEYSKSELFLEALPLLTGRRVELPDNPRLLQQFASLDRRRGAQGRDAIQDSGRRGAHDDLANAVAGGLVQIASRPHITPVARVGRSSPLVDTFDTCWTGRPGPPPGPTRVRNQPVADMVARWK